MDGIPITVLDGVGVVGIAVLLAIGFATGRVYTRAQVVDMQTRHAAEIDRLVTAQTRELDDANHERGEWRTEARLKDQTITEQASQITAMQDGFGVLKDFLVALRRAGLRVSQEEDS